MMSSTKKCEPLSGHHNAPFYSRYTEHKVATSFPTPDEFALAIPLRSPEQSPSPLKSPVVESLYTHKSNSFESCSLAKTDQTTTDIFDLPSPLSRNNSEESYSLSIRSSPVDAQLTSPNLSLYSQPLSKFRSSSIGSNGTISPNTLSIEDNSKERRDSYIEKTISVNNHDTNIQKSKETKSSLFHKHSITVLAAATFKLGQERYKKKLLRHSCPDLVCPTTGIKSSCKSQKSCANSASFSELNSFTKQASPGKDNKLKVPDLFTTSFTHSKGKPDDTQNGPDSESTRSTVSLQDIPNAARKSNKRYLRRTISLTKTEENVDIKSSQLLCPNMYRDDQIAQVTDYLFIGSIESAYNERRLCRLEVESLVDISNVSEMQVPSHKKTQCPCLCQTEFKHFRSRLIIAVADEENENIDQYFEEVNRFIEGARRCSKKVLVYSYEGKSRAAVFAIQYLMSFEGLLLRQAYNMVKKQRPQVSLNPSFQKALEQLEKAMYPDEKHSVNICNEYLNVADPQAIKCAWIDC